jgi:hypothetical protein
MPALLQVVSVLLQIATTLLLAENYSLALTA